MGRTAPSFRAALRDEVARLRRVAARIRDKELRSALDEALDAVELLHDAYVEAGPPPDPVEAVLLAMIAELYRRLKECREGSHA